MSTPYRSDAEALQARLSLLEEQLAAVKERRAELTELQLLEGRLQKDIDDVRKNLEGVAGRKSLRILENVRVASPCNVSWDAMKGNGRARFCTQCQKNVYNLSGMSREEAESFVLERTDEVCIRLYRRHDDTVLTSDCPVGMRKRSRKWRAVAVFSGLVVTALFARGSLNFGRAASTLRLLGIDIEPPNEERAFMGVMVAPQEPMPANASSGDGHTGDLRQTRMAVKLMERVGGPEVIASVPAHELVFVKRTSGEWVLVSYVDSNRVVTGWTLTHFLQ